jgi:predicted RNA-binding Zn ribbon-like protein
LRAAVRALLEVEEPEPADVERLNTLLATQRGALHLDPEDRHTVRLVAPDADAQLRLDIAAAVLDVFRHDRRLIRRCANPACVLLFLDVSKSGRRRWCDMATCGNRAKAAAHAARHRRTPG